MAHGQHKLSRRALLGGACAVVPLCRNGAGEWGQSHVTVPSPTGGGVAEAWAAALACWNESEAEVEALARSEDQDAYDSACGRHDEALAAVLGAAAPDGAAAAWKLELIAEQRVFELECWEEAVAVLRGDVLRIGAPQGGLPG